MAKINFPKPAVDGQLYPDLEAGDPPLSNGTVYVYDANMGVWKITCSETVVTTPNVYLENDELAVGSLYQKVLETPTVPVIGDQETANIAFAEIIDNLKAGGATVIISDTPPGRDPYADPHDPYGGYEGLETGDLWVDSTNFDMYVWEGDAWVEVGNSGGIANAIVSDNPPLEPEAGFLWFNTTNANLYVYTGEEWVETGAAGRVSPAPFGSGSVDVDLSDYATIFYVDNKVSDLELVDRDQQRMINTNINDIANIYAADYATEDYVDSIVAVQNTQINEIADDVAALKANGGGGSGGDSNVDLSSYATKTYVDTADAALRADIDKKIEDPSSENKQYVRKKGGWEEFSTAITTDNIPSNPVRGQIYLTAGNEIVIGV